MSESVLQRYVTPRPRGDDPGELSSNDNIEELDIGPFGWLRGVRERSLMLEFRKKDGTSIAHDYGWLRTVEFDPSVGITLNFGGPIVKIIGRNLEKEARPNVRLVRGLLGHRVPWIQQASDAELIHAGQKDLIIEAFRFE